MPAPRCKIVLVDPALRERTGGNRVTALRWAAILRGLGARVVRRGVGDVDEARDDRDEAAGAACDDARRHRAGDDADLLVALHAVRSAPAIERFHAQHPGAPIVVACTGTDLHDRSGRERLVRSLALARAVVVLQENALPLLPPQARAKTHVVLQSVCLPPEPPPRAAPFQVVVLANLRAVKDPLLAARAAALLPATSRVRVLLLGRALDPALAEAARALQRQVPRFTWLGPLPRAQALRTLQASHALVNSSHSEGGANAVGEAIAAGVPPLVTAIPGSLGLLGADWPAAFAVGDAHALRDLLLRVEVDAPFRADLEDRLRTLAPRFAREREVASWQRLLHDLLPSVRR